MIALVVRLTLREILGQRRTLFMLVLAAVPIVIAMAFRIANPADEDPREFASVGLLASFIVHLVLPLVALVFGTAALGQEVEDGTAVYLLAKPQPRWKIVIAKLTAAWLATAGVVVTSVVITGSIVLLGETQDFIVPAFAIAVVFGALAYSALFVCLSVVFTRALVIGLVYVFVWEAIFSQFAPGTQFLSIREYTLAFAKALANTPDRIFNPDLGAAQSAVLMVLVIAGSLWLGIRRLRSFELGERT